jgi:hypothetical protein
MGIRAGSSNPSNVMLGNTQVVALCMGDKLVWPTDSGLVQLSNFGFSATNTVGFSLNRVSNTIDMTLDGANTSTNILWLLSGTIFDYEVKATNLTPGIPLDSNAINSATDTWLAFNKNIGWNVANTNNVNSKWLVQLRLASTQQPLAAAIITMITVGGGSTYVPSPNDITPNMNFNYNITDSGTVSSSLTFNPDGTITTIPSGSPPDGTRWLAVGADSSKFELLPDQSSIGPWLNLANPYTYSVSVSSLYGFNQIYYTFKMRVVGDTTVGNQIFGNVNLQVQNNGS